MLLLSGLLLIVQPVWASLKVMVDEALEEIQGGVVIELSVSDGDFYGAADGSYPVGSRNLHGAAQVTVVRFASDIYIETYGEIGSLKMGNYPRTVAELGDMASMDSNYTIVFGPQNRAATRRGTISGTYAGTGGDDPYYYNTNRTDRISDRYSSGSGSVTLGLDAVLSATTPPNYFGSVSCAQPYTQWDINWERMQVGLSPEYPLRMYGLLLRAEFDNWGTADQRLRRFVLGSNNLYGYAQARPLVTSGWLASEMAKINTATYADTNQVAFQLRRDPFMDQYWSLSSFNLNPDVPTSEGSFRQFWFNTNMLEVTTNPAGSRVGRYVDKNHGFFLMVDTTDRRFSGWNLIGGVNEYRNWPPLEQPRDHYFENQWLGNIGN